MEKKIGLNFQSSKIGLMELKRRLFFVICTLIIFRIGSFIPIPGIDATVLNKLLQKQKGSMIELFNMFSGGSLIRASIFSLGIIPYISASIITQLITLLKPRLKEKNGENGSKKISNYTRYGTLLLSIFQSIFITNGIQNISSMQGLVLNPGWSFYCTSVVSLVTGTMLLMWLGEKITGSGIGNGISTIIFTGIVAGIIPNIRNTVKKSRLGEIELLIIAVVVVTVTFLVILIERGQRRIMVHYAQRQQGFRVYSKKNTHLPLKVNVSGVLPAIFASNMIVFQLTILSWFTNITGWNWIKKIEFYLQPGKMWYMFFYASEIIFFCFFYTKLVFNSSETAEKLKKSGAFIKGMRPGEQTAKYIKKIIKNLTIIGSIYVTFICLIPEFMRDTMKVPLYFGGTSLLIVVVVIMDFLSQVQTLLISNKYKSALKNREKKNRRKK